MDPLWKNETLVILCDNKEDFFFFFQKDYITFF